MDEPNIRELYDPAYAAGYDERFLTGAPWAAAGADFELELLAELLAADGATWLDVACGTGWFLARFPEVARMGLDLSPAMLAQASAANPGVELVEGSYLDRHPEWEDRWSVVSCMWFAYAYVDTVAKVEAVLDNLARWTAPDGSCFVPVCDLVDLSGGTDVPYLNSDTWTFGGPLRVVGYVWSWTDEEYGKAHQQLVCPHVDHLVAHLGRWFRAVEVVHYPPLHPGWGGRRALVASEKRTADDDGAPVHVSQRVEAYRGEEEDPPADGGDLSADDSDSSGGAPSAASVLPSAVETASEPVDPEPAVPPDRQSTAWRYWRGLPPTVRRAASSTWRILPARFRGRLWSVVSSSSERTSR